MSGSAIERRCESNEAIDTVAIAQRITREHARLFAIERAVPVIVWHIATRENWRGGPSQLI
jgi:hypothetical protein